MSCYYQIWLLVEKLYFFFTVIAYLDILTSHLRCSSPYDNPCETIEFEFYGNAVIQVRAVVGRS